jgi:hypothetical protein
VRCFIETSELGVTLRQLRKHRKHCFNKTSHSDAFALTEAPEKHRKHCFNKTSHSDVFALTEAPEKHRKLVT